MSDQSQESSQAANQSQAHQSQAHQSQGIPADFLEALNQKFSEYDQALAKNSDPTLEKLKQAFAPQQKEAENKKWIDKHLGRILEARQRGQEMPITEDLVVELQRQMDETAQLKQALADAQKKLERMTNPATWQDNAVYSEMDNTLSGVLEKVYGESNPRMHALVSETIAERLKQTKQQAPEVWEKIRNDKSLQRKVVMKAVSEVVPPQAMAMMRQQHEASKPVTLSDWNEAWEETDQIENPEVRSKAKELLRQKLYEMKNPMKNARQRLRT